MYITGESMIPEFEPGDLAIVNPHLPPIAGVTCIFYGEEDGEARATIKRLRRQRQDAWLVRQWNPPEGMKEDFALRRADWPICHRTVGKHSRRQPIGRRTLIARLWARPAMLARHKAATLRR